jgi:hypothetical protein
MYFFQFIFFSFFLCILFLLIFGSPFNDRVIQDFFFLNKIRIIVAMVSAERFNSVLQQTLKSVFCKNQIFQKKLALIKSIPKGHLFIKKNKKNRHRFPLNRHRYPNTNPYDFKYQACLLRKVTLLKRLFWLTI